MKKLFLSFWMLLISCVVLVGCGNDSGGETPTPTPPDDDPVTESVGFSIHYNRPDGNYTPFGIWLWEDSGEGALYEFDGEDDYGAYVTFEWSEWSSTLKNSRLGFIVRQLDSWVKDVDEDRYMDFSTLEFDSKGYYNIYLKSQDPEIYTSADGEVNDIVQYFDIAYNEKLNEITIWFQTNKEFSSYEITLDNQVIVSSTTAATDDKVVSATNKRVVYSLGSELPDIEKDFNLKVTFKESGKTLTKVANNASLFKTQAFKDAYTYDGDLGAIYTKENTIFRVWTPISKNIKLRIYTTGTPAKLGGSDTYEEFEMTKGVKGTWEYTCNGDMAGKYYTYVVTNGTYKSLEIVDPYAKSTGINGLRGMIVDFAATNPDGWDDISIHEYDAKTLTVYETHIADMTSSATWNGTASKAKLYSGFYEAGTKYNGVTTGFDHIKELGVNAVQILPIFDQANDEREENRAFNWGYNPLNYNALDGIYSSDPYDGYQKIKEFKELVKAYNEAGINIIMDVVYNHVAGLDKSNFDVLMPNYYYRYTSTGPSNGSGCGNETASEMPMFRKFMLDSTEFWASEYKLGGFRFDLMGIHDVETMNQLAKNVHDNVSDYVTIYGEPWAGGTIAMPTGYTAAMQSAMNKYDGYGCFNDKMRDALIKGGLNAASSKGWITNNQKVTASDITDIKSGLVGKVISTNKVYEPDKCVNYVTCHDNYTLYDRIKAAGITDEATIKKMALLANSMVFTSQGVTFMLAGEEMLRTKGGNENSYDASYAVNEMNYELKVKNIDFFNAYKSLIALKQTCSGLSLDGAACKEIIVNVSEDNTVISYDVTDTVNQRIYRIVHSNGVSSATGKTVDLSGFELYLDTLNTQGLTLTSQTTIANYQTIIAYKALTA